MRRLGLELAGVVVLGLLACGAVLLVRHLIGPVLPPPDVQHERNQADSIPTQVLRDNARLLWTVDSLGHALRDSASKHRTAMRRSLATADVLRDSIAALEAAGHDSAGLALSCPARLDLRTREAADLRTALGECQAKGAADSTRAQVVSDSLGRANALLILGVRSADSARKAEVIRPRPCRRSLLVVTVSCATAERLAFVVGVAGGFAATR